MKMPNFISNLFKKPDYDTILIDGIDTNGKPSNEKIPWAKIEFYPLDDGRVRVETDWTPGLITLLRKKYNYAGTTDEAVFHRFLAEMHGQQLTEFKENNNYYE